MIEGTHSGLWPKAHDLLRQLPQLVSSRVRLFALEFQSAGVALAWIVALGVAAALTAAIAWLALWASAAAALIELRVGWGWSILIVALVNVVIAAIALAKLRSLLQLLTLPATLRRLGVVGATVSAARDAASSAASASPAATREL